MKDELRASGLIMICFFFSSISMAQQTGNWDNLGTKSIDRTLDRDVVQVSNGVVYKALRVEIESGTVNVYKTTIHFKNGETQDIILPEVLSQENDMGLIDLKNNKRVIEKITFWYDTKNSNQEKAVIKIWARK